MPGGSQRCTCDSGPAFTGNCAVFSTWMPAFWLPLNGVTIGEVAPGSQPRLNGTFGLLNHKPRWYWWVGANVVVPPGDTEKVSESNTPRTVAVPVPVLPAWMSVWYQDTPNGAPGVWMTNRSNPVLCGMPEIVTFMMSFSAPVVIVTLPLALGRHVLMAAEDACRPNVNEESVAVAPVAVARVIAKATTPVVASAPSFADAEVRRLRDLCMAVPLPRLFRSSQRRSGYGNAQLKGKLKIPGPRLSRGPGRAVPVQDQRVAHAAADVRLRVPDRPDVGGGHGAHPGEHVGTSARVGAGHPRPEGAVPLQDQRLARPGGGLGVVADRPGVALPDGADPVEQVVPAPWCRAGALHLGPGRAAPLQHQRAHGGAAQVAAHRPGAAVRGSAHALEKAVRLSRIGAGDLCPGGAVPVQQQGRELAHGGLASEAGRPRVPARHRAHPVELGLRHARGGRGHLRPCGAVPVQDQREGTGGLGAVEADLPGAICPARADAVERVEPRARVRAGYPRPCRAVPVQDQRVADTRGVVDVGADRPGVTGRVGAHAGERVVHRTRADRPGGDGAGWRRPCRRTGTRQPGADGGGQDSRRDEGRCPAACGGHESRACHSPGAVARLLPG